MLGIKGEFVVTKVVSFINMKGGVGKSTLSMMVAEFLFFRFHKRVLTIDIDSQRYRLPG